jgi:hypothetical protein
MRVLGRLGAVAVFVASIVAVALFGVHEAAGTTIT